jgi:hypothetical protein
MATDPHVPWIEKLIRDAQAAGEFDDLPGAGAPIEDLERSYEPAWWARRFIERERLNEAAIELASRIRRDLPRLLADRDEAKVRRGLEAHNIEVGRINADLPEHERLEALDVGRILSERSRRHG